MLDYYRAVGRANSLPIFVQAVENSSADLLPILEVNPETHTAPLSANPRPSNRETDARYWSENAQDALDSAGRTSTAINRVTG
jgi:hypothetical protein